MRRSLRQRAEAVAEAIDRSGRSVHIELVCTLICAVDGSVVSALVEGRDPRAAVLETVVDLIDVLAPIDQPYGRTRSGGSEGVTMYPAAKSP